ncbi:MAG: SIMPL domain-containing protein [Ilumatobacteraceae bacterium]
MATARWVGLVVGGVALGAAAVGIVAAVDDGPESSDASTPATAGANQVAESPAGTGDSGDSTSRPLRTITVSGVGTATGTPDTARVWLGVEVQAASANEALDGANEKAAALLAVLEGSGIEAADVQTSNVSLYPRYDNNGRNILGYVASNDLTVVVRDLDRLGGVLDAAAGLIGNEIRFGGISLYVDDTDALESEARGAAVADARAAADEYATAAGVELGQVISISEVSTPTPSPIFVDEAAGADSAESVPIAAGSQEYSMTITVVYEIA